MTLPGVTLSGWTMNVPLVFRSAKATPSNFGSLTATPRSSTLLR